LLFCLCVCVMFTSSLFLICYSSQLVGFILFCISSLCLFSSSVCRISLSIFCGAVLVVTNSFSFCLLWKFLIFSSIMNDRFTGYINLGSGLFSLRVCPFHALLAFRVSGEKCTVILMNFPLYVTCHFSIKTSNILSLFCIFSVLTIICLEVFLFNLVCLVFWKPLIPGWPFLAQDWRSFLLLFYYFT
jgi:hypothetical protein